MCKFQNHLFLHLASPIIPDDFIADFVWQKLSSTERRYSAYFFIETYFEEMKTKNTNFLRRFINFFLGTQPDIEKGHALAKPCVPRHDHGNVHIFIRNRLLFCRSEG